jgi:hypothetical protein
MRKFLLKVAMVQIASSGGKDFYERGEGSKQALFSWMMEMLKVGQLFCRVSIVKELSNSVNNSRFE